MDEKILKLFIDGNTPYQVSETLDVKLADVYEVIKKNEQKVKEFYDH